MTAELAPSGAWRLREAALHEYDLIAGFWAALSREEGWLFDALPSDWMARSIAYHKRRHAENELRSFIAEIDGRIVGCATGFVLDGYPREFVGRPNTGHIVGVYVEPEFRRRGIGRDLTRAAVEWLGSMGCTTIRLRTTRAGRGVYESLGFAPGAEMELRLRDAAAECPGPG